MAASSLSKIALLLSQSWVGLGKYIEFPVYDSTDQPTGFKDGLPAYVTMTRDYDFDNPMEQFLLCTSCTISYIFGNPDDFVGDIKATEMMSFKHNAPAVPV